MKKIRIRGSGQLSLWKKCFRLMKLTFLFMMMGLMQISASVYSQTAKLKLNMRNARVIDVLEQIEKQSEFRFAYSAALIDLERRVSVNINEKNIGETLDALFAGTGVKHVTYDRHIMLYPQELDAPSITEVQQQRKVSGIVTDETGQPLPGVSVVVKGTSYGTVTNADGNYSLTNIQKDAALVFSFVGMKTQEVEVGNQANINVVMEEETIGLEEVIAAGYGVQKKSDVVGSVVSISAERLERNASINIVDAMQGAAPGLSINRNNGRPGSTGSILIRGKNSISASNTPLIVLDGIPYTGSLGDLNPNDIQSIEILKDASASAIYGSKVS